MKIRGTIVAGGLAALLLSGCCNDVYKGDINGKQVLCEVCPDLTLYKITIGDDDENLSITDSGLDGIIDHATIHSSTTPYELSGDDFNRAQKKYDYYKPICEKRSDAAIKRAMRNVMN